MQSCGGHLLNTVRLVLPSQLPWLKFSIIKKKKKNLGHGINIHLKPHTPIAKICTNEILQKCVNHFMKNVHSNFSKKRK